MKLKIDFNVYMVRRVAPLAACAALALVGCVGAPPRPSAQTAERAHVQLGELEHGRELLLARCTGCHRPPMPADHLASDWPSKLDEMSGRARLAPPQRAAIEAYLVAMAPR